MAMLLLFGMPRSGTTWIGKIFDSHPDVLYRHEPDSVSPLDSMPLIVSRDRADQFQEYVLEFARRIPAMRHEKVSASMPFFRKSYLNKLEYLLYVNSSLLAKAVEKFTGHALLRPLVTYSGAANPIVVWKSIESLGRIGCLNQIIPDSKAIALLRHPCGHVSSVLDGERQGAFDAPDSVAKDLSLFEMLLAASPLSCFRIDDVRKMTAVERIALRWVLINESALNDIQNDTNAMVVRYEDICEEPLQQSARMFTFAGLALGEQTEAFIEASTSGSNESYYSVVKNPLESANKWRKKLSAMQIAEVNGIVSRSELAQRYYPPAAA
ncbi:sulfotransferase [Zeimonas arvi]|uniref:Sulfotransferase n=1 Tax=Zeimonas arvi TaxID=2498847 RepID=A0A5C8NXK4_9BURK|nr:sulfotransferase [Zeimonas arvi]TXL65963.1 sulfotransferase [Zeimonas arvi]